MSRTLDHTLLLIKPDASHHEAAITEKLKGAGLTVLQVRAWVFDGVVTSGRGGGCS